MTSERQRRDPVFRVLDYEGVEVVCSHARWVAKVDRHHTELVGREDYVSSAVERPAMVLRDRDHPNRKHHMVRAATGRWLKVVVDYQPDPHTGDEQGTVVTLFFHRRLRRGDSVLYIRGED